MGGQGPVRPAEVVVDRTGPVVIVDVVKVVTG